MTRGKRAAGEKVLYWVGSCKQDLMRFPEAVQDRLGAALSVAQFGGKHPHAKPWKGEGAGVLEIVAEYRTDAFRAIYTVQFRSTVYAVHVFQKKSPHGAKTPLSDVRLVRERLKLARAHYEEHKKTIGSDRT
ncbi:MAG: type II toxin-antitoxin system RelE/ParE family toxin [Acidobacteriales bacterium]|nr:type II toxin-antitoxin system RelE/ParE family toxin [Terriglobales bacterium]